jgi:hypothetical protein
VTDPAAADKAETDRAAEPAQSASPTAHRLRTIPALAVASMLVAGGLLMAVSGMVRLVGPAPPTPTPTVRPTAAPTGTSVVPSTDPLGPSASPRGAIGLRTRPV